MKDGSKGTARPLKKGGEQTERLSQALPLIAAWYRENRRPLPWRIDAAPYHVWVSEIMLQQTRIEAVIPYYARFLAEFPAIKDLAEAPEDRLLKLWEGLGYYSRARNLQKAARIVMEEFGGELPRTAAQLRRLPGIGDYTAGAIASIACGQAEPAVDGNVLRVIMRILASREDIAQPAVKKRMTELLRGIYPSGTQAGLLTEGLMELGERICIPNGAPDCRECPVRQLCLAAEQGLTSELPVKAPKKARRIEKRTVLVLRCGSRYALRKRPEKGLLAGLWEFPNADGILHGPEILSYVKELGLTPLYAVQLEDAKHIFTHVEWHMKGWLVECCPAKQPAGSRPRLAGADASAGLVWATAHELMREYSIPTAFKAYKDAT